MIPKGYSCGGDHMVERITQCRWAIMTFIWRCNHLKRDYPSAAEIAQLLGMDEHEFEIAYQGLVDSGRLVPRGERVEVLA
jgi:hypothetical protein